MACVVACDLDGVVWRGDEPIPGSPTAIQQLRRDGAQLVYVTNNSSTAPTGYVEKLRQFGIEAAASDVVTSAAVASEWLQTCVAPGAKVLACAGEGVRAALHADGFVVVDEGPADAVVVGWHREFDFERLRVASDAIRSGAIFVATNDDPTYPGAGGSVLPGNGSLVAAVATASGIIPTVTGKPHAPMADFVRARFGTPAIMIGDRVSTDGAFARTLGCPFGLVRSGIAEGLDVTQSGAAFVADDLAHLVPMLTRLLNSVSLESDGAPTGS